MSYASLPSRYPGMYRYDEGTGLWVPVFVTTKKADGLCRVFRCPRPSEKAKGYGRGLVCGICRVRLWRANNPIKANYNAIKNKARRRKIPFDMSFSFFEQLCLATGFHIERGRAVDDLQIDRINALRGYHDDNVQILTTSQNRDKLNTEETRSLNEWEEFHGMSYDEVNECRPPVDDDPF